MFQLNQVFFCALVVTAKVQKRRLSDGIPSEAIWSKPLVLRRLVFFKEEFP